MDTGSPYRPRVSRETRLLLTAGVMAVAALWLLARIRFPERLVTPNPVPSVLDQLAGGPTYDDLARDVGQLSLRVAPSIVALGASPASPGSMRSSGPGAGLRFRDDMAVTVIPTGPRDDRGSEPQVLAYDPASGIAVVRVPGPRPDPAPALATWTPRQFQQSRYLLAADVSPEGMSLQPIFVGWLNRVNNALWTDPLWGVPAHTDLSPGMFLFTSRAELAGVVIAYGGRPAIVPGGTVLAEAERLLAAPPAPAGRIGVEVQSLSAPIASLTGALSGVVVTWVDPEGAARGQLMAGDVIETVDGRAFTSRQQWDVRVARLAVGETLHVAARRRGQLRDVVLVATAAPPVPASRSLGLTLRTRTGMGAEILRIEQGSAADRAGLIPGDVITLVADVAAPTSSRVVRSYASTRQGERVMVGIMRGEEHFVTTLER